MASRKGLMSTKKFINKKVLLRERKRHTARRVVTIPSVVLTGYPPILTWPGGYPAWGVPYLGTPPAGYPLPGRVPLAGYPHPHQGTPLLPGRVPPPAGPGRVPPPGVCPMAFWEMLQGIMGYGYPPCGQTD